MSYPGSFISVFARNCSVVRIDKDRARTFIEANHRFGWSKCRHCYALEVSRTGKDGMFCSGDIVAVSCFSNARRWLKGNETISSYEWVRYASLKGVRVCGGMGKMMQAFIDDVHPDDIMSYCPVIPRETEGTDSNPTEDGDVYVKLGFSKEGIKEVEGGKSVKFRLKLKDYKD